MRAALFVIIAMVTVSYASDLTPRNIALENGKSFTLRLHKSYDIIPAAEGMKRIRFFAKAPDGRIFVTDMYNLTDNKRGKVYALDDWDPVAGKFNTVTTYMSNLHNPNSVAFYTDEDGKDWFYLAETHQLTRRRYVPGGEKAETEKEVLATFPAYGLSYKYGGWHLTRTVVVGGNGKLYVSVGSSCNACRESERVRATILEMNPDGSRRRIYARGMRNAVGMLWLGRYIWATNQAADHLGPNKPDDTFHAVRRGRDYGWPQCYQYRNRIYRDRFIKGRKNCRIVPKAYSRFRAHSSAMGFDYFDDKTKEPFIKNSFLMALHGSTNKTLKRGYKVVVIRKGAPHRDFLTGFLEGNKVHGRPLDIFKLSADTFLLSDDHTGVVYYLRPKATE